MAEGHWDRVRAIREHPGHVPEVRMHETWKTRWDVEKSQGPSRWKSPEELAATAWEGELCNDRGSGSLRAWLPDTRKETPLVGPGWQRCGWFEARLRIQGCRERCRIVWVLKGAAEQGKAGAAAELRGGVRDDQEAKGAQSAQSRGAESVHGSQAPWLGRGPAGPAGLRRATHERGHPLPSLAHLEHKPDEDAEHQAEADVRMVVDDELLAEKRVTFRPPAESHGSGRAAAGGASTLRSRAAAQTSPAPARSARRPAAPLALPPAGLAPNNFWGPPPSSARPRPSRPEPPPAAAPSPPAARTRRAGLAAAPPPARLTLWPPGRAGSEGTWVGGSGAGPARGAASAARVPWPRARGPGRRRRRRRRAPPHSRCCGPAACRAQGAGRGGR